VLLVAVITWCVGLVLTPLGLYVWLRFKLPTMPEVHALVSPVNTYLGLWGLNCGIAAVCAVLLIRRSAWAVWPITVLVAWRVWFIGWHGLRGSLDAVPQHSAVWWGLAMHALVLAAIMWLRQQRVLQ